MASACWNEVTVYGPDEEIALFRRTCIRVGPSDECSDDGWNGPEVQIGLPETGHAEHDMRAGSAEYAWNYRASAPTPGSWSFAFDTRIGFPDILLGEIAALFPSLHFDCGCIASQDEFMGYGWINVPPGGEPFRQDLPVRRTYWSDGGCKRTPAAEARHQALIKALLAQIQAGRDPHPLS